MPALVNMRVGSSSGTTDDDGTNVWPCCFAKKSMNCWRISLAVGMRNFLARRLLSFTVIPSCRSAARAGTAGALAAFAKDHFTPAKVVAGHWCRRRFVVAKHVRVRTTVPAVTEHGLQIQRHVWILFRQRYRDARQALTQRDRIDL